MIFGDRAHNSINNMIIEKPTSRLVDKYIRQFNSDERYYPGDQAIIKLFRKFPSNKKFEEVLLKVIVINDLYSTNILATYKMAEHILKLNIDKSLKGGDPEAVHRMGIKLNQKSEIRKLTSILLLPNTAIGTI